MEPFWFEMGSSFAFFSWAFLHCAFFALFISSLQTLIQATLRSLLNSWTGFKKASSDDIKREVFSVYNLNPSGISIPVSVLAILAFNLKLNWDVTGEKWRENCVRKATRTRFQFVTGGVHRLVSRSEFKLYSSFKSAFRKSANLTTCRDFKI